MKSWVISQERTRTEEQTQERRMKTDKPTKSEGKTQTQTHEGRRTDAGTQDEKKYDKHTRVNEMKHRCTQKKGGKTYKDRKWKVQHDTLG